MFDILGKDLILPHFFKCMNCKNILPIPNKRTESFQLALEHSEAMLR